MSSYFADMNCTAPQATRLGGSPHIAEASRRIFSRGASPKDSAVRSLTANAAGVQRHDARGPGFDGDAAETRSLHQFRKLARACKTRDRFRQIAIGLQIAGNQGADGWKNTVKI